MEKKKRRDWKSARPIRTEVQNNKINGCCHVWLHLRHTLPVNKTECDWLRCSPCGTGEGKTQSLPGMGQLRSAEPEPTVLLCWATSDKTRTPRLRPGDKSTSHQNLWFLGNEADTGHQDTGWTTVSCGFAVTVPANHNILTFIRKLARPVYFCHIFRKGTNILFRMWKNKTFLLTSFTQIQVIMV